MPELYNLPIWKLMTSPLVSNSGIQIASGDGETGMRGNPARCAHGRAETLPSIPLCQPLLYGEQPSG